MEQKCSHLESKNTKPHCNDNTSRPSSSWLIFFTGAGTSQPVGQDVESTGKKNIKQYCPPRWNMLRFLGVAASTQWYLGVPGSFLNRCFILTLSHMGGGAYGPPRVHRPKAENCLGPEGQAFAAFIII